MLKGLRGARPGLNARHLARFTVKDLDLQVLTTGEFSGISTGTIHTQIHSLPLRVKGARRHTIGIAMRIVHTLV